MLSTLVFEQKMKQKTIENGVLALCALKKAQK
jgi:hypothetical protein